MTIVIVTRPSSNDGATGANSDQKLAKMYRSGSYLSKSHHANISLAKALKSHYCWPDAPWCETRDHCANQARKRLESHSRSQCLEKSVPCWLSRTNGRLRLAEDC